MAGRTEFDAYRNFRDKLQEALSCVTVGRLTIPETNRFEKNHIYAVVLQDGDPVKLSGEHGITLSVLYNFRIVDADGDLGPFKVKTVSYFYVVATRERRETSAQEIFAYHWEPETSTGRTFPHLHIGGISIIDAPPIAPGRFHRLHFPTARVPLEQVLRFLIVDLAVTPLRSDWEQVLRKTEAAFVQYKTR